MTEPKEWSDLTTLQKFTVVLVLIGLAIAFVAVLAGIVRVALGL